jgi:hypothetical protein
MSIPDYQEITTSGETYAGRVSSNYKNVYEDSAPINISSGISFGRAYQVKAGSLQALAVADLTAINLAQSLRVALYNTTSNNVENLTQQDKTVASLGKIGFFSVPTEEEILIGNAVRVRLLPHASDPLKQAVGVFAKTADTGKTAVLSGAYWKTATGSTGRVCELFLSDYVTLTID